MNIGFGFYPGGKKKALTMSYDDGQVHDRKLVEIFNRYGIRGTFHLNSGRFDTDVFLKSTEIRDLFEGHEISAHTLNHPYLTILPGIWWRRRCLKTERTWRNWPDILYGECRIRSGHTARNSLKYFHFLA